MMATSAGGGISNNGGTLTLTNCTLSGNSAAAAGSGGGINNNYGTATLTNCTLSGNSAINGGGIANWGTATLTNCTLSGNSASADPGYHSGGGGIYNNAGSWAGYGPGKLTLRNTIVANSPSGGDCIGPEDNEGGHNVIGDAANSCGLTNGVNGNLVGVDPQFDPAGLKDNGGPTQTIALLSNSPAINAGDPEVCANAPVNGADQRGHARPGSGHPQCSIGAYEADVVAPSACTGDCDDLGSVTVDEIITLVNIALGTTSVAQCSSGDTNHDNQVTIDEILTAVNRALAGCG